MLLKLGVYQCRGFQQMNRIQNNVQIIRQMNSLKVSQYWRVTRQTWVNMIRKRIVVKVFYRVSGSLIHFRLRFDRI